MKGRTLLLRSFDKISDRLDGEQCQFSRSFLNSINETGVPPHELHLRDGDICFLTINLSKKAKLMNNTKVEILKVKRRLILIRTKERYILYPESILTSR